MRAQIHNSAFISLAGDAARGAYFTSTAGPVSLLPDTASFIKRYQKRFGKAPETYSPYAFDAANVVLEAIETAYRASGNKTPTRAAVATAARGVELSGVTGRIGFTERGDRRVADYFVLQYKTRSTPEPWCVNSRAHRRTGKSCPRSLEVIHVSRRGHGCGKRG
ncbi:MAG: ABC transporter substrate-binding protein [Pleurocapsa sp. SU_196_0]|nr:ABC transporter substrate-binding protein [Pleurocapsa sp. SU_196_0]